MKRLSLFFFAVSAVTCTTGFAKDLALPVSLRLNNQTQQTVIISAFADQNGMTKMLPSMIMRSDAAPILLKVPVDGSDAFKIRASIRPMLIQSSRLTGNNACEFLYKPMASIPPRRSVDLELIAARSDTGMGCVIREIPRQQ